MKASFRPEAVAPGSPMKRGTSCRPEEGHERARVAVEVVAGEQVRHLAQVLPLAERLADLEEEGEVEEGVDARVDPVEAGRAALEEGEHGGIAVEQLPHHPQVGVLAP